MNKANLFLIGVNKSGTSWLYYLLDQHPDVFMADAKELHFFGDEGRDAERPDDLEAYHQHFPFDESYRYYGDATVMYYRSAATADEIKAYNPEAKLLAIVRDPIQRLRSQFQYHKQLGLLDEDATLSDALDGSTSQTLLRDSHYEETLPAFTERFGTDQFKIVSLEEGIQAPETLWKELLGHLDLQYVPRPPAEDRPENPTGSAAFRWVYRNTARPLRRHLPDVFQWLLQNRLGRWFKLGLLRLLGTAEKASIPPEVQARLRDEFAPTYDYLHQLGFEAYDETRPEPSAG